jgi:hypothetical protein
MKRRSWNVWVAGIALVQLLVLGVDVAMLPPTAFEAEQWADRIQQGMVDAQWDEVERRFGFGEAPFGSAGVFLHCFADGSRLTISRNPFGNGRPYVVVGTQPPTPTHPLASLRRTLARMLPFLEE